MPVSLGQLMKRSDELSNTQFAYRKGSLLIRPVMHFVLVPYTTKYIGEWAGG